MKGWLNLLVLLIIIIAIGIVYLIRRENINKAKLEKEFLLKEKEELLKENKRKEKLRDYLEQKFKKWLYSGYTFLLAIFLLVSFGFSSVFFSGQEFDGILKGIAITECVILVIALYSYREPHEFKYILTQFAPFLKKKIYGEHINIESEIALNYSRIKKIDKKVKKLDKIIFA